MAKQLNKPGGREKEEYVAEVFTSEESPYSLVVWNDEVNTEDRTGLTAGTYTVTVTDINGCSKEQNFTVSLALGVTPPPETIPTSVSLYPNPAFDQFVIAIETDKNTTKTMSVEIVNVTGQIIYSSRPQAFYGSLKKQIDLSGIADGVYTTRVTIDGKGFFNQLVIQH